MAAPLSIREQDAGIRHLWPSLRTVMAAERLGIWRGSVTPLSRPYEIQVSYAFTFPEDAFAFDQAWFPEVTVLEPALEPSPMAPGEPIPHLYGNPGQPERPILCLFDPRDGGWSEADPIAETILPWACSWLRFYEIWQATGVWTGGGARHPALALSPAEREPPAPAPPGRRARRLGCFASRRALLQALRVARAAQAPMLAEAA